MELKKSIWIIYGSLHCITLNKINRLMLREVINKFVFRKFNSSILKCLPFLWLCRFVKWYDLYLFPLILAGLFYGIQIWCQKRILPIQNLKLVDFFAAEYYFTLFNIHIQYFFHLNSYNFEKLSLRQLTECEKK